MRRSRVKVTANLSASRRSTNKTSSDSQNVKKEIEGESQVLHVTNVNAQTVLKAVKNEPQYTSLVIQSPLESKKNDCARSSSNLNEKVTESYEVSSDNHPDNVAKDVQSALSKSDEPATFKTPLQMPRAENEVSGNSAQASTAANKFKRFKIAPRLNASRNLAKSLDAESDPKQLDDPVDPPPKPPVTPKQDPDLPPDFTPPTPTKRPETPREIPESPGIFVNHNIQHIAAPPSPFPFFPHPHSRIRTESLCSMKSSRDFTVANLQPRKNIRTEDQKIIDIKRESRERLSNKDLDKSKLRMFDMIYFNPQNNPMKPRSPHKQEKQEKIKIPEVVVETPEVRTPSAMPVPQLRLNANGEMVLDETTLVIENEQQKQNRILLASNTVVYHDDLSGNYGYYKRQQRTKEWPHEETVKFYRCLNTVGTDFSLMLNLFPNRSRRDLKLKFKKEERSNPHLIDKALLKHNTFDLDELKKELDLEEEQRKKEAEAKSNSEVKELVKRKILKKQEAFLKSHSKIEKIMTDGSLAIELADKSQLEVKENLENSNEPEIKKKRSYKRKPKVDIVEDVLLVAPEKSSMNVADLLEPPPKKVRKSRKKVVEGQEAGSLGGDPGNLAMDLRDQAPGMIQNSRRSLKSVPGSSEMIGNQLVDTYPVVQTPVSQMDPSKIHQLVDKTGIHVLSGSKTIHHLVDAPAMIYPSKFNSSVDPAMIHRFVDPTTMIHSSVDPTMIHHLSDPTRSNPSVDPMTIHSPDPSSIQIADMPIVYSTASLDGVMKVDETQRVIPVSTAFFYDDKGNRIECQVTEAQLGAAVIYQMPEVAMSGVGSSAGFKNTMEFSDASGSNPTSNFYEDRRSINTGGSIYTIRSIRADGSTGRSNETCGSMVLQGSNETYKTSGAGGSIQDITSSEADGSTSVITSIQATKSQTSKKVPNESLAPPASDPTDTDKDPQVSSEKPASTKKSKKKKKLRPTLVTRMKLDANGDMVPDEAITSGSEKRDMNMETPKSQTAENLPSFEALSATVNIPNQDLPVEFEGSSATSTMYHRSTYQEVENVSDYHQHPRYVTKTYQNQEVFVDPLIHQGSRIHLDPVIHQDSRIYQDPVIHQDSMIHQDPVIQQESYYYDPVTYQDSEIQQDPSIYEDPEDIHRAAIHQEPPIHQDPEDYQDPSDITEPDPEIQDHPIPVDENLNETKGIASTTASQPSTSNTVAFDEQAFFESLDMEKLFIVEAQRDGQDVYEIYGTDPVTQEMCEKPMDLPQRYIDLIIKVMTQEDDDE